MNKLKKILVLLVTLTLVATTVVGCSKKSDDSIKFGSYKTNNITEVYAGTSLVAFSYEGANIKENDTKTVKADKVSNKIDITDVKTNTVDEKYVLPEFTTDNTKVNYISPLFIEGDVKSVEIVSVTPKAVKEAKENGETTQAAKFGDEMVADGVTSVETSVENVEVSAKETELKDMKVTSGKTTLTSDNYTLWGAGEYVVEVKVTDSKDESETLEYTIEVKEGSLSEDLVNDKEALSNMAFNKNSDTLTGLKSEIETELPLAIEDYKINKADDYINSFAKDNELILKELNMINKVKGEKVLTVDEVIATFGTDEKIAAAKLNADGTERSYDGNGLVRTTQSNTRGAVNDGIYYSGSDAYALLNQYRSANGLAGLVRDAELEAKAYQRAIEIVSNFSHSSAGGYNSGLGENIAMGVLDAQTVTEGWYNSPGHRANMLGGYQTVGIAHYSANGLDYWVQLFDADYSQGLAGLEGFANTNLVDPSVMQSLVDTARNQGYTVTQETATEYSNQYHNVERTTVTDTNGNTQIVLVDTQKWPEVGDMLDRTVIIGDILHRDEEIMYYCEQSNYSDVRQNIQGIEQPDGTIIDSWTASDGSVRNYVWTPYLAKEHVYCSVKTSAFENCIRDYVTYDYTIEYNPDGSIKYSNKAEADSGYGAILGTRSVWNVGDTFSSPYKG